MLDTLAYENYQKLYEPGIRKRKKIEKADMLQNGKPKKRKPTPEGEQFGMEFEDQATSE